MAFAQLDRLAIEAGFAPANDNRKPDDAEAWHGSRKAAPRGTVVRVGDGDGPEPSRLVYIVTQRFLADACEGEQRVADNDNWPLLKVLRRDGLDHCVALAERYRRVFDRATDDVLLMGSDAEPDMFTARRMDIDESSGMLINKGMTRLKGRKHPVPEIAPTRALRTDTDQPKGRSKAVPKVWHGDDPLIAHIDAKSELAGLRYALHRHVVPFEAAVCESETFDEIGRRLGFISDSASRARPFIMSGFQRVDSYWQRHRQRAA
jgi:hypothetical protein